MEWLVDAYLLRYKLTVKRIVARFYRTEAGNEPVRDWLVALSSPDRKIVGKAIATVEFGWPVGMPICRSLREGVLEVRSTIRSGKVEARVYFAIESGTMLLLHGVEGKRGQSEAMALAIDRLGNHRRRMRAQ